MANLTFGQQLALTLLDKALLSGLTLALGYWLNRQVEAFKRQQSEQLETFKGGQAKQLEAFKRQQAEQLETLKLANAKRIEYLEKQLSQFYWPIYMRLQKDNAIWTLRATIGPQVEANSILPNHKEIVRVIETNTHLAQADEALMEQLSLYMRHIAAYEALRLSGNPADPMHFGDAWPKDFFSLIKARTETLQAEYERLVNRTQSQQNKADSKHDGTTELGG